MMLLLKVDGVKNIPRIYYTLMIVLGCIFNLLHTKVNNLAWLTFYPVYKKAKK